jgi:serine protease
MPRPTRPRYPYAAAVAALLLAAHGGLAGAPVAPAQPAARNLVARGAPAADATRARVIVKFKADGALAREAIASAGTEAARAPRHAARLSARMGLALADGIVVAPQVQVIRGQGLSSAELAARLSRDPDVEYAEVDQRVRIAAIPNDPLYAARLSISPEVGQWYLRPSGASALSAIDAEGAWAITPGSPSVVIAVLDTGVRYDHPDLAGKLLPGYDFVAPDDAPESNRYIGVDYSSANDGDGRDADASDPGDWITFAEDASGAFAGCGPADSSWHGTQVAGLIGAATDNGIGMAGSGRDVRVLPVRVLGKCGGFQSDIAAGMRWAAGLPVPGVPDNPVANRARVVNMSLGSEGTCGETYQAAVTELTRAGVVVVVAAGNTDGFAVDRPANCSGALGVAGVRHTGTKVGYSSLGPELAIAAPAGNHANPNVSFDLKYFYPLLTTTNSGARGPETSTYSDGFEVTASVGTSFAAPLVSGTVALMLSANPSLTVAQIRAALQASARPFPTTGGESDVVACHAPDASRQLECYCTRTTCGAGLLDAHAAVARAGGWVAAFTPASGSVQPGTAVSFDASATTLPTGRVGASYRWTLTPGDAQAQIVGPADGVLVQVQAENMGSYELMLEVTDTEGVRTRASRTVSVTRGSSSSGGGGGGALGWPWLALLGAAVLALSAAARRRA